MADEYEVTAEIRPTDRDGSGEFSHDQVKLTATNEKLRLSYCEPTELKGDDGNYRTVRKSFYFDFSYLEFEAMIEAVERARKIHAIATREV